MSLQEIGAKYGTDKALHHKYLDFYEKQLPGRDFDGRLLEIGIMDGHSLKMWRDYYPKAEIVGIDINKKPPLRGVKLYQMDATDINALRRLGSFDIILDDGSHMTADQQSSFLWLYYNQLNPGGLYIIEDLHTSLMTQYINSEYTTLDMLLGFKAIHFRRDDSEIDSMTAIIPADQ